MALTWEIFMWLSAGLLIAAALLAVIRVAFGPTILDRAVATDLLTSVGIGFTVLLIVWWQRTDLLVLLVLFAITGLFSSTTISRFLQSSSFGDAEKINQVADRAPLPGPDANPDGTGKEEEA